MDETQIAELIARIKQIEKDRFYGDLILGFNHGELGIIR